MSIGHNRDVFFVDTGLLRDHVSKLREQRNTAARLQANVMAMKNCSDPSDSYRYNSLLCDIERLIEYLDRMANVLSVTCDDAIALSRELGGLIYDDTVQTRHSISKSFTL